MRVEILSANKQIYKGEAKSLTLLGKEGKFQVLENHAPLFALLNKSEIIIDGNKRASISSGIVEVLDNKIIILIRELNP